MKKISINISTAVNKYGLDRAFEICKRSGFDALDDIGYQGTYNLELALGRYGDSLEDFLYFAGKFMRRFVDNHGRI